MTSQRLTELGWKACFSGQLSDEEDRQALPVRIGAHFGSRVLCLTSGDDISLPTVQLSSCGDLTVGDWLLLDKESMRAIRRLDRDSCITRKAAGSKARAQLIAANLDTLFIVSSCNNDFNPSRLERYLTLAAESQVAAVVVLTKADLCEDRAAFRQRATQLKTGLLVETVDARDNREMESLAHWCGVGQTVGLVGSSGVGKSTLAMSLGAPSIPTQGIREDDSKGRHTTTTRSIHRLDAGGLMIDTPGMRELQLADCEEGMAEVFDDIVGWASECRFRDCSHEGEPGCAIAAAIAREELDPRRLKNYRKLQAEQARNAQSLHERRDQDRRLGQFYKMTMESKRRRFE